MRKCLSVCACLVFSSLFLFSRSTAHPRQIDQRQRYADDQILVKYKAAPVADPDLIAEEIVRVPGAKTEALTNRPRGRLQLIHLNSGVSIEEAVRRANEDPRVEFAEPDYIVHTMETTPNDPLFFQMW